ncbi:MAG: DNA recombination protein RmuC [Candidatus Nanohalobium sp.]
MIELVLGVAVLFLGGGVLFLGKELKELKQVQEDTELEVDPDKMRGAISESWQKLELDKTIGSVESQMESVQEQTKELEELHQGIETMLKSNQQRGEFGERKLETILSEHLPSSMYGLQEQVVGTKKPDAYIDSSAGKICIDAKFPLDRFRKMKEAEDEDEKQRHRRKFRSAVEDTLSQVADKYVKPEKGTTDFAFEFVPSEAVYYYLVKEEYDLLQKYVKKGVQVSSPLTLGHKLELVKSDLRMEELTERAEEVREELDSLQSEFQSFEQDWKTFYDSHLSHLTSKADDLNSDFRSLKQGFDQVNLEE